MNTVTVLNRCSGKPSTGVKKVGTGSRFFCRRWNSPYDPLTSAYSAIVAGNSWSAVSGWTHGWW
ncbi:hypothetical protein D3C80_1896780 [compost metagenome]